MGEENAIRAIIIGVSLFVFVMILSVIVFYYNTAIRTTDILKYQADYGTVYERNLQTLKDEDIKISGAEVKNIIRKIVEDYNDINITINSVVYNDGQLKDGAGNILEAIIYVIQLDKLYKIIEYNNRDLIIEISFEEI